MENAGDGESGAPSLSEGDERPSSLLWVSVSLSILRKSSSISSAYVKSSNRSGDAEDPRWVDDNAGEELKGEAVTGYEGNDPVARGDERTADRGGEGPGEA